MTSLNLNEINTNLHFATLDESIYSFWRHLKYYVNQDVEKSNLPFHKALFTSLF